MLGGFGRAVVWPDDKVKSVGHEHVVSATTVQGCHVRYGVGTVLCLMSDETPIVVKPHSFHCSEDAQRASINIPLANTPDAFMESGVGTVFEHEVHRAVLCGEKFFEVASASPSERVAFSLYVGAVGVAVRGVLAELFSLAGITKISCRFTYFYEGMFSGFVVSTPDGSFVQALYYRNSVGRIVSNFTLKRAFGGGAVKEAGRGFSYVDEHVCRGVTKEVEELSGFLEDVVMEVADYMMG